MPTLHKYAQRDGFYVKHSFVSTGKVFHVVYQVDGHAESQFAGNDLRDESHIPRGLFHELLDQGHLYTNKSGASGAESDLNRQPPDSDAVFEQLSDEARRWILMLTCNHPAICVRKCDIENMEFSIDSIPDGFLNQLLEIARRYDGTMLFKNLMLSYSEVVPNKKKS